MSEPLTMSAERESYIRRGIYDGYACNTIMGEALRELDATRLELERVKSELASSLVITPKKLEREDDWKYVKRIMMKKTADLTHAEIEIICRCFEDSMYEEVELSSRLRDQGDELDRVRGENSAFWNVAEIADMIAGTWGGMFSTDLMEALRRLPNVSEMIRKVRADSVMDGADNLSDSYMDRVEAEELECEKLRSDVDRLRGVLTDLVEFASPCECADADKADIAAGDLEDECFSCMVRRIATSEIDRKEVTT